MSKTISELEITIATPTKNRAQTLPKTIEALYNLEYPKKKLHLVFVDSYSEDQTVDIIRGFLEKHGKEYGSFQLIQARTNIPEARNISIRNSKGDFIYFLDSDVIPQKDWLKQSLKHFEDPKVGGVLGVRYAFKPNNTILKCINLSRLMRFNSKYKPFASNIFRIRVLDEIGGFDERLTVAEDSDIGIRMSRLGYLLAFEPNAIVLHQEPSTLTDFVRKSFWHGKERVHFCLKYPSKVPYVSLGLPILLTSLLFLSVLHTSFLVLFFWTLSLVFILYFFRALLKGWKFTDKRKYILPFTMLGLLRHLSFALGFLVGIFKYAFMSKNSKKVESQNFGNSLANPSIGGRQKSISQHPRVLMISGIFYPKVDGSVIAVSNLLKILHECGHKVELITRKFPETRSTEKWMGIQIKRVGPHKALLPHRILFSLNQVRVGLSVIKGNRADIIHAHGFSSLLAGLVIGKLYNKPVVAHFHGFQRLWHSKVRWKSGISLMLTYPIEKLLVNLADAIIAQSNALKIVLSQLYRANPNRISVIPHVLDTGLFTYVPRRKSDDPIILFVGSLLRVHGADLFIKAAPAVLKDFPQAKFMLIGKGPQKGYLKKLIESFHLENSVFLVGQIVKREELARYYAASTVVVIPLYYKGYILSLVALEAMATGRPVVTTMELDLELRESGVYSVRPNPDAIAQAVKGILRMSSEQYSEIGYSARKYIEKQCSAKVAVSTLSSLYVQLISHRF